MTHWQFVFCRDLEKRIPFSIAFVFAVFARHRMSALVPCQNATNAQKALEGQEILQESVLIQIVKDVQLIVQKTDYAFNH